MIALKQNKSAYYGYAFFGGVVGALVMSALEAIARNLDMTSLNIEAILGSMVTGGFGDGTWGIGLVMHLIAGGVFALIYAGLFQNMRKASASLGMGIGFIHWIVAGLIFGVLAAVHPLIPEQVIDPGFFAANLGITTVVALLALHLVYGGIVGSVCAKNFYRVAILPIELEDQDTFRKVS